MVVKKRNLEKGQKMKSRGQRVPLAAFTTWNGRKSTGVRGRWGQVQQEHAHGRRTALQLVHEDH